MRWQWHQLDHMQIIWTSLQTDNHATQVFTGRMHFLPPNQQCQSTEGTMWLGSLNARKHSYILARNWHWRCNDSCKQCTYPMTKPRGCSPADTSNKCWNRSECRWPRRFVQESSTFPPIHKARKKWQFSFDDISNRLNRTEWFLRRLTTDELFTRSRQPPSLIHCVHEKTVRLSMFKNLQS